MTKQLNTGEPVAWMQTWQNQDGELKRTVNIQQIGKQDIPLYTHPADLTDEEIIGAVARGWCSDKNAMKIVDSDLAFAIVDEIKAILRKAQEKVGEK